MQRIFESFFTGLFVLALLLPGSAKAEGLRVVVFGDSLVSGYQLQPQQAFPARLDAKIREIGYTDIEVISMAYEGLTSAVALDRLPALMDKKPDIVIVAFGVDDVERGVLVEQTYNNLAIITGRLMQAGAYVILAGIKAPPELGYSYVKQFENMYRQVATARRTLFVENLLQGVTGNSQLTLADGLHPNSRGVDQTVENTYRYVDTCIRTKIQAMQYQQEYKNYQQNMR